MRELETIDQEVSSEYQQKQGRYDVYLKGIYRLLYFYIKYRLSAPASDVNRASRSK